MFNFFVNQEQKTGDCYLISGSDYNHICNVLRMNIGDTLIISCDGCSDLCEIAEISNTKIKCKIIEENYNDTSLPIKIYLFQGLPKSDKMELTIQKCVELGVEEIYPVEMENCVVRLEEKKKASKTGRWQKISESAAKQCKRSIIPKINTPISFNNALKIAEQMDSILIPYENENGMEATKLALSKIKSGCRVAVFIGPEGGFDKKEIELARKTKADIISLGKRILRTETAAITAVSMCMLYAEMNV